MQDKWQFSKVYWTVFFFLGCHAVGNQYAIPSLVGTHHAKCVHANGFYADCKYGNDERGTYRCFPVRAWPDRRCRLRYKTRPYWSLRYSTHCITVSQARNNDFLLCPLLLLIPQTISIWACNLEVKQTENVIFVAGLPLAINPSAAFGTSSAGASGAGQILGQTPVAAAAPQLILTGNTLQQSGGQTAMQQLLIPVSTGGYQTSSETSSKLLLLSGTYWFNLLNVRACFYTQ